MKVPNACRFVTISAIAVAKYCQMSEGVAMKIRTMNVSLTPRLARHVQSQLGGDFANASEYIRELLRRDMLAKRTACLSPLSSRDLAEIAGQIESDPVFERMARHRAAISKRARL